MVPVSIQGNLNGRDLKDLHAAWGQPMLPKRGQRMVQVTRDSGEVAWEIKQSRKAESRLGEPRKQNGGERRARLGRLFRPSSEAVPERRRGGKSGNADFREIERLRMEYSIGRPSQLR